MYQGNLRRPTGRKQYPTQLNFTLPVFRGCFFFTSRTELDVLSFASSVFKIAYLNPKTMNKLVKVRSDTAPPCRDIELTINASWDCSVDEKKSIQ
ncbi:hypothetical protein V6N11_011003 [Hibiscus sabdariffa]|uniref:Uncharacterized protein n=1 Tax=Hibiscus sabdariffa TaxID=183260 RepID=A0ABR2S7Q2_9ROSI